MAFRRAAAIALRATQRLVRRSPCRHARSLPCLSFGLVSIPVKLYSATKSASDVRFNLLAPDGSRVKQQYVSDLTGEVVERSSMKKAYEFEKGRFVVFTGDELKALEEGASHVVEIVSFVPEASVDPIFYDKAYFIAPDRRGGKPYSLLQQALTESGRCALAQWAYKGKTRIVQVRPAEDGMVFQQLLFADEVRSLKDLHIEHVAVSAAELKLALQIIEQGAEDAYDAAAYEDEEKKRILAAIDRKIEGKEVISPHAEELVEGGEVIDLMEALRASLGKIGGKKTAAPARRKTAAPPEEVVDVPKIGSPPRACRRRRPRRQPGRVRASDKANRRSQSVAGEARVHAGGGTRRVVGELVDAGFVPPEQGPRNELRFSFQDVVLLRTALRLVKPASARARSAGCCPD
ncbi:Ku domain protein [Candidatus Paraburkholderia kirkii UZHbot1]|uniref:Non-homologous end joining protein Ku n=1 Tax=Candidatus Paraburkholderia kirkii UZHbot1 TaxID=1055526 RepID=G4MFU0_9BURK|nr:Ku domain protein [Candidatus Paraburkholderia kirkii UZHbot1]